ncbi:MAG TPA: PRC-barrel domain-containing protein [Nitrolancea sp.]|nr:PRC-barrel domain-containing protein [Nitrolancea sp.]
MSWNPSPDYDYDQLQNLDVYGAQGQKIGSVNQILTETTSNRHYLLVKAGPLGLGTEDYYIPETAIDMVGQDRVVIDKTEDQLKSSGWTKPPR